MVDPAREIAYGAIAGCLGKFIEFPFDTVKVRLQSSHGTTSTVAVIRQILRTDGLFNGFYKGLKAPLAGACVESAVLFSAYEYAQNVFSVHTAVPASSLSAVCSSGAFSGFAASFVLTPVELVKCNLQVANLSPHTRHESYGSIVTQIVRKQGLAGLWSGLSSTLIREMAGTAVWFASYEQSLALYGHWWPARKNTNSLLSGATAGFLFNLSIYPVDTVKSYIQTAHVSGRAGADQTFLGVLRSLVSRPRGLASLYNGLSITLLRSIPANAVIFFTYDYLKATF